MTAPTLIAGLAELAGRYDVLLCDVWGVIHNGREHFPVPCEALVRFAERTGPVILISNSPRPSAAVTSQLDALGVPRAAWNRFVTSGDATRTLLAERAPGPAWFIGPERDGALYEGLGLETSGPENAAFIACTGPVHDEYETPEDYRVQLQLAADRGLTMICANPDKVVQRGEQLVYCGGALADLYEAIGGAVVMAGKPFAPIYDLSLQAAEQVMGRKADRARVLCIGDGAPTDVKGANDQGLDCLFIAGGIHAADLTVDGQLDPLRAEQFLAREGAQARWAMPSLVW